MDDEDLSQQFSDALVSEIKAEMGRQDLSSRALGRLVGKSSQYMSDRLDGGNSKTGKRVTLNVWDLAAISRVLGLSEVELVDRAQAVVSRSNVPTSLEDLNVLTPEEELKIRRRQLGLAAKRGRNEADIDYAE